MKLRLPWHRVKANEGFFVPCLDIETTTRLGLLSALPYRVRVKAVPCIKDGLLGVWFGPKNPATWTVPAAPTGSQNDESLPVVHVSPKATAPRR
jgi:hypothetical protein